MTYRPPAPRRETELGTERLCRGCGEWWPQDPEFYYMDRKGKVIGNCRACWSERTIARYWQRKVAS